MCLLKRTYAECILHSGVEHQVEQMFKVKSEIMRKSDSQTPNTMQMAQLISSCSKSFIIIIIICWALGMTKEKPPALPSM